MNNGYVVIVLPTDLSKSSDVTRGKVKWGWLGQGQGGAVQGEKSSVES